MKKNCIINVAVREPYVTLQKRLVESLMPYDAIFDIIPWTHVYPKGSMPHEEMNYSFKAHAFQQAINMGYQNILWLDAACYAIANPKIIFDIIDQQGYYFVEDKSRLADYCSDMYLDIYGVVREQLKDVPLLSGSIYGFNVNEAKGLTMWEALRNDEACGLFMNVYKDDSARIDVNKDIPRPPRSLNQRCDTVPSHRHDEAILAYHAWINKCKIDKAENGIGFFQGKIILADKNIE